MFCPNCGAEYREGFTHCSDCDVELVEKLPDKDSRQHEDKLDDIELVPVLSTRDMTDVITIKSILDSEGIEYLLRGENMMYIDSLGPAIIFVKEEEVERVKELLKDIKLNYIRFAFDKKQYK